MRLYFTKWHVPCSLSWICKVSFPKDTGRSRLQLPERASLLLFFGHQKKVFESPQFIVSCSDLRSKNYLHPNNDKETLQQFFRELIAVLN